MYFKMDTDRMELTAFVEKEQGPAIFSMIEGRIYEPGPRTKPFSFSYQDEQDPPLLDYIASQCLMSRSLVACLEQAGVDNLQKFDASLIEKHSGEINNDFFVVNVIGLVEAADMDSSESLPLGSGEAFSKLVVDQEKAKRLLVFRLSESQTDLIVHERVANAIKAGSFRGVTLTPTTG